MVRRFSLILIYLTTVLYFSACETYKYRQDVSKANFHSLEVKVNGKSYHGIGVVPKADKYKIEIIPSENVSRLVISTCHIKRVFDKPKKGFFSKAIKFDYKLMRGLEDKTSCMMHITVLDHKKEAHDYAILDFGEVRPDVQLPSIVRCSGEERKYVAASVCQAPVDTHQSIRLPARSIFRAWSKECKEAMHTIDYLTYEFNPVAGKCIYYFTSNIPLTVEQTKVSREPGKFQKHRLTVFGVTDYPFKEK